jgi:hypothetical protein
MSSYYTPFSNYENKTNGKKDIIPSDGIGYTPTIEQNRQVITVSPEDPAYIRASSKQDCLPRNWNDTDRSENVYGVCKGEPVFAMDHGYPDTRMSRNGAPFLKTFTSLTNLKQNILKHLRFVGIVQQPGAAYGEPSSVKMQQYTVAIGGTQQICNNSERSAVFGPCCIVPYALTKQCSDKRNYVPRVKIRGLPTTKMIGQVIMINSRDTETNLNNINRSIGLLIEKHIDPNNDGKCNLDESVITALCNETTTVVGKDQNRYIQEFSYWSITEFYLQLLDICLNVALKPNDLQKSKIDKIMRSAIVTAIQWQDWTKLTLASYERIQNDSLFPFNYTTDQINNLTYNTLFEAKELTIVRVIRLLRQIHRLQYSQVNDFLFRFYAGVITEHCNPGGLKVRKCFFLFFVLSI